MPQRSDSQVHISDQVAAALLTKGFSLSHGTYVRLIENYAPAGSFSAGARRVVLAIDASGRWLERQDGWGRIEKDVDLRDYTNDPDGAITAVLA